MSLNQSLKYNVLLNNKTAYNSALVPRLCKYVPNKESGTKLYVNGCRDYYRLSGILSGAVPNRRDRIGSLGRKDVSGRTKPRE
jgi:hypothetical protein